VGLYPRDLTEHREQVEETIQQFFFDTGYSAGYFGRIASVEFAVCVGDGRGEREIGLDEYVFFRDVPFWACL